MQPYDGISIRTGNVIVKSTKAKKELIDSDDFDSELILTSGFHKLAVRNASGSLRSLIHNPKMSAISIGASACLQSFESLGAYLQQTKAEFQTLIPPLALENEVGRFKVWLGNLGVLQKGHSSLDYRLRESPLMQTNVLKLLKELSSTLVQTTDVLSCKRLPYENQTGGNVEDDESSSSQDSDGTDSDNMMNEPPMTELQHRLLDISRIIDYLYKLSTKIRDPNMRSRSLRAALYKEVDEETGVELLSQYAIFDRLHTREMFREFRKQSSSHEDDSFLVDQLSRAITKRRQQFKYWKKHRTKLASGIEDFSFKVDPVPATRNQANEGATNQRLAAQRLKPDIIENAQNSIISETEITKYLDRPADIVSEISVATTAVDMKGEKVELPPPPRTLFGKDFECPYCFIICPFKYSRPRAWRAHLLQDLQPYSCTYPDCPEPDRLYSSRREWLTHEHLAHRSRWRCPQQCGQDFFSRKGIELHMDEHHAGAMVGQQLITISDTAEYTSSDARQSCPVCLEEINVGGGLHNHLANHFERLAAFAFPRDISTAVEEIPAVTSDHVDVDRSDLSQELTQSLSLYSHISDPANALNPGGRLEKDAVNQLPDESEWYRNLNMNIRSDQSTAQASHSMPHNRTASTKARSDYQAAVPITPIVELWNQAYEELRENEPKLIEKYEERISYQVSGRVGKTTAVSGLRKVRRREQMEVIVKQKLKGIEDGDWRIPLADDLIAIRDLCGYVASIVDWRNEFVDTVSEFSPYDSIAWAGVCLLLPLLLRPSNLRVSDIRGLEFISDLLGRCAIYESAYHQRFEVNRYNELDLASDGYKSALKELYLRILRFQVRNVNRFSRNLASEGVHTMFEVDDYYTLLEDIKLQEANCQPFFDLVKDQEALDAREEAHRQRSLLLLKKFEESGLEMKEIGDPKPDDLASIHYPSETSNAYQPKREVPRPRKWGKGQQVWLRQGLEFLRWVQDYQYSEEREGWEYKLRDKDGNLLDIWVREEDTRKA